jgi:hypothetical protein
MKGSHLYSAVAGNDLALQAFNSFAKASQNDVVLPQSIEMEQILLQIERALHLLRLARPTHGLWVGSAASSLLTALSSLESELLALQQQLNW